MENANRLTCLVLEPVAIVAEDLVTIIAEVQPGIRVLVAGSVEAALDLLQGARVDIAFLNLSPTELARGDLVARLERMGATLVLPGHAHEGQAPRYRFVERPFASTAIAAELRSVLNRVLGRSRPPDGGQTA